MVGTVSNNGIISHGVSFVQESPTRELGEQSFPDAPEPSAQPPASSSPTSPASPTERLSASDDSSDGNASEESKGAVGVRGWQWGDPNDGLSPQPFTLCYRWRFRVGR